jgi:sarcosine oxidase
MLTSAEVSQRFPGYHLPEGHRAVLQPEGGYLLSERCIVAHVVAAQALGAEVHARERVTGWEPTSASIRVTTDHAVYEADHLIVSAGAWVGEMVPGLKPLTTPERQVLAWLQPTRPDLFAAERFPVFNLQVDEGHYYGFPLSVVPGFKFGRYHHLDEAVDPETIDREPNAQDETLLRQFAERYFPEGAGPTMALRACMFTNAPDEHFILDLFPQDSRVVVASPCSGHGFKFSSVVGEITADLAETGETRHDIGLFRMDRFVEGMELQRIRQ